MTAYSLYWRQILNRIDTGQGTLLTTPEENEHIKRAHEEWKTLLMTSRQGYPFKQFPASTLPEDEFEWERLFEIHPTLGVIQMICSIRITPEQKKEHAVTHGAGDEASKAGDRDANTQIQKDEV